MLSTIVSVIILCNNYNYDYSPRCQEPVDYFVVEDNGEAWGYLTNGIPFTQTNVTNELGLRFQKFQLEDMFYFITDKGVIYADSKLEALSVYLSK